MKKSLDQLLRDSLDQPQPLPPVDDFWQDFAQRLDGNGSEGGASEPPSSAPPETTVPELPQPTASGSSSAVKSWMVIGAAVAGLTLLQLTDGPAALLQKTVAAPSGMVQNTAGTSAQKEGVAPLSLHPSVSPQTNTIGSNTSTPQTQTGQTETLATTAIPESKASANTRLNKPDKAFSGSQNAVNTAKIVAQNADRQFVAKGAGAEGNAGNALPATKITSPTQGAVKEGKRNTVNHGDKQPETGQKETLKPKNGLVPDQAAAPALSEEATTASASPTKEKADLDPAATDGPTSSEPAPSARQQWQVPGLDRREWALFAPGIQIPDVSELKKEDKAHGKKHPPTGYVFTGTEPFYSQRYQPNVAQLLSFGIGAQWPMRNNWGARAEFWHLQTEGLPLSVSQTTIIDPDGTRITEERTVDVYRMNRFALNLSAVKRMGSVSFLGGLSLGRWTSGQIYETFSSKSEIFGNSGTGYSSGGGPIPDDYFNLNYLGLKLGVEVNPFDSRWLAGLAYYQQANDMTRSARWTTNQDFMLYVGWKF